jgi:hypothetical protein
VKGQPVRRDDLTGKRAVRLDDTGPLSRACRGCPCGQYTDTRRECRCTPRQIETCRRRISGPLLDRTDAHVEVPRAKRREMRSSRPAGPTEAIRAASRRVRIYCVTFGKDSDTAVHQVIASKTGGAFYHATDQTALEDIFVDTFRRLPPVLTQ